MRIVSTVGCPDCAEPVLMLEAQESNGVLGNVDDAFFEMGIEASPFNVTVPNYYADKPDDFLTAMGLLADKLEGMGL